MLRIIVVKQTVKIAPIKPPIAPPKNKRINGMHERRYSHTFKFGTIVNSLFPINLTPVIYEPFTL